MRPSGVSFNFGTHVGEDSRAPDGSKSCLKESQVFGFKRECQTRYLLASVEHRNDALGGDIHVRLCINAPRNGETHKLERW